MLDITNIPKNNKQYNGNTRKYGITIQGTNYIIKFPKDNDLSVYSEYIASNFIRSLGVPCHEVQLAIYKGMTVNLIKDFTSGTNLSLHSFKDTKQSSEDTNIDNKEYTYDDVLYLIDKHLKMRDTDKLDAKRQFWIMFICDAILGNRDRHWGNWGYLESNGNYRFAPLYDNGASLYPGVNKVITQYINPGTRKKFLYDRVYTVPASLFKIRKPDRSYRSNYADMFKDLRVNKLLAEQTNLFKRSISIETVFNNISSVCNSIGIPLEYKRFYIEIVTLRYMCIILRENFNKDYDLIERELNK